MIAQVVGVSAPVAAADEPRPATDQQLLDAAAEFEAILVAQMLRSAGVAESCSEQTYRGMILDAMATGVSQAGGLGLGRQVAAMLVGTGTPPSAQVGKKSAVHGDRTG